MSWLLLNSLFSQMPDWLYLELEKSSSEWVFITKAHLLLRSQPLSAPVGSSVGVKMGSIFCSCVFQREPFLWLVCEFVVLGSSSPVDSWCGRSLTLRMHCSCERCTAFLLPRVSEWHWIFRSETINLLLCLYKMMASDAYVWKYC